MNVEYATDPVYTSPDQASISLTVKFKELPFQIEFGATPIDPMSYGRELYHQALAGKFGPIAPFVPPERPSDADTVVGAQTL